MFFQIAKKNLKMTNLLFSLLETHIDIDEFIPISLRKFLCINGQNPCSGQHAPATCSLFRSNPSPASVSALTALYEAMERRNGSIWHVDRVRKQSCNAFSERYRNGSSATAIFSSRAIQRKCMLLLKTLLFWFLNPG